MGLEINKVKYNPKWKLTPLKNLCNRISDGTHFTPKYVDKGVPFISVKDIYNDKVHFDKCKYITIEEHNDLTKRCKPEKDDILITKSGTIGRMALVPSEPEFSLFVSVALIKNKKEVLSSKFLRICLENFLNSINIQQDIKGGLLKNFHLEDIRETLIPVVPLEEQSQIVQKIEELFSELDKGVENLRTAQQQLKVYRQTVLKWAFEGKLTNDNIQDGELPEGWEWVELKDVVTKNSTKALPTEMPDAQFIGMDCIKAHALKPHFTYSFSEFKSAGNYFEKDQVLYGRMRPYLNKVYKAEFNGACSGEFIVLKCKHNFIPDLLKYILHSREFVSFANHKTAGDRPRISYDEIIDYPIVLCEKAEQLRIVQEIESRLSVCDNIEETITNSLQQAESLRQSILKKAFEGKLIKAEAQTEIARVISVNAIPEQREWPRKILAGKIISSFQRNGYIGRTKFQKILYVCENYAQLEFDITYVKEAAGPLDSKFLYQFIAEAKQKHWIEETHENNWYKYEPGESISELVKDYPKYFRSKSYKIQFVIKQLHDKDTDTCELIATIYAILNNYIIEKQNLQLPALIKEVYDWDISKSKFSKQLISSVWQWMKGCDLVPVGFGALIKKQFNDV